MILDDFDDHGLIEEPVPKHASVFVDKWVSYINKMLENTDGAIKNGQFRETGNVGYTRRRIAQHNMCWSPLYVNKHQ